MIKCECKNGKVAMKLDGGFKDLCADAIHIIRGMYLMFEHEDSEVADKFKNHIIENLDDAFKKKDAKHEAIFEADPKKMVKALDELMEVLAKAIKDAAEDGDDDEDDEG